MSGYDPDWTTSQRELFDELSLLTHNDGESFRAGPMGERIAARKAYLEKRKAMLDGLTEDYMEIEKSLVESTREAWHGPKA